MAATRSIMLDESRRRFALAREGVASSRELGVERRFGDFLRCEVAGRLLHVAGWSDGEQLLNQVLERSPPGLIAVIAFGYLGQLCAERGQLTCRHRGARAG